MRRLSGRAMPHRKQDQPDRSAEGSTFQQQRIRRESLCAIESSNHSTHCDDREDEWRPEESFKAEYREGPRPIWAPKIQDRQTSRRTQANKQQKFRIDCVRSFKLRANPDQK